MVLAPVRWIPFWDFALNSGWAQGRFLGEGLE
jgi:hypothetical protein